MSSHKEIWHKSIRVEMIYPAIETVYIESNTFVSVFKKFEVAEDPPRLVPSPPLKMVLFANHSQSYGLVNFLQDTNWKRKGWLTHLWMKFSEENLVYVIGKHYKKEKSTKIICGEET